MHPATIGRMVHYTLSETDAQQINARRTTPAGIQDQVVMGCWSIGAQAHIGNTARAGDVLPAVVVRVLPNDNVNARVLLDGTDVFWATTRPHAGAATPGHWHWPARV